MKQILNVALCSLLLTACIGEIDTDPSFVPTIIVEGRIEEGGAAEVQLTKNISYIDTIKTENLQEAVIRWAKVTVTNDRGESEVLTAFRSERFSAGFGYRGSNIVGEVGVTYSLKVEYSGVTLTADTTIPEKISIDSLVCQDVTDTSYAVVAYFRDLPSKNAYFAECRTQDKEYYSPCLLGIVDDNVFSDSNAELTINQPVPQLRINSEWRRYFSKDEKIRIRISNVGPFTYRYWSYFENESLNAANPIFPADNNLPSNIVGDNGRGIWAGYNSCYFTVEYQSEKSVD